MKRGSFLAFALLSVSIMSYGISGGAFADNHNIAPMSVSTELPSYEYGDTVNLSGNIRDYDSESDNNPDITMMVISSQNSPMVIGQFSPDSDGSFTYSFKAGGVAWMSGETYTVKLSFGATTASSTFVYAGGDSSTGTTPPTPPPPPPPPPPPADRDNDGIDDLNDSCPTQPETVNGFEDEDGCPDVAPPPTTPPTTDPVPPSSVICGNGTQMVNGVCEPIPPPDPPGGDQCMIATAAYGSDMAPQVQMLREIRDNTVLSTASGSAFMSGFNSLYYSFAPTVADWERENVMFKESVRAFITPMIYSLSIMTVAQDGSEAGVLGLGISVILLNLGIYIAAPAFGVFRVYRYLKSRKRQ